jgi:hypothetical protein
MAREQIVTAVIHCPISSEIQLVRTLTAHNYYGAATAYAAPSAGLCLEEISTHFWPPGFLLGQNKLTKSVNYFYGLFRIVQAGHDHGTMCIHCEMIPAPDNLLTLMHIPLSSRKTMYSASTVKMNGEETGCLGLPLPAMMLICADPVSLPAIPGGDSMMNCFNNVRVGMSAEDILMGFVNVAFTLIVEAVLAYISAGVADSRTTPKSFIQSALEPAKLADPRRIPPLAAEHLLVLIREYVGELAEGTLNNFFGSLFDAYTNPNAPVEIPAPPLVPSIPQSGVYQFQRTDGAPSGFSVSHPLATLGERTEQLPPPWLERPERIGRMFSEEF